MMCAGPHVRRLIIEKARTLASPFEKALQSADFWVRAILQKAREEFSDKELTDEQIAAAIFAQHQDVKGEREEWDGKMRRKRRPSQ